MSHPYVNPYVTGVAYTEPSGGRQQGDWQLAVMAPVLNATDTVTENMYGAVDSQGRVAVPYPLAARTATPAAYPLYTRGTQGVAVTIVVTVRTGASSIVVSVEGYDPGSATWIDLLDSAAINSVSTTRLLVAPGLTNTTNLIASTIIPDTMRIVVTHGNSDSITYSVGLDWM